MESQFINRRILITKPELNGKRLGQLKLRKLYGINITRINRAGVDLVAKAWVDFAGRRPCERSRYRNSGLQCGKGFG